MKLLRIPLSVVTALAALSATVFTALGQEITHSVLASFTGTNGSDPWASLIQGADGNFYGTTFSGGENQNPGPSFGLGYGTVFRVTPGGVMTVLASFNGTNGINPIGGLVEGSDGHFYGTTWYGGVSNQGTVFEVTASGALTTLTCFTGTNGAWPRSGLVRNGDGSFYGTTQRGGASFGDPRAIHYSGPPGNGSIFKITTNGMLATLYSFTPDTQGTDPFASLTLASDGMYYGIANGGSQGWGMIFKMTVSGDISTLALLDSNNGMSANAPLIESRDGSLFGVSQNGGVDHAGGVFRISMAGSQSTVVSFSNAAVYGLSFGALVEAPDGNFYGVRSANPGSIFRVRPDGDYSVVFAFASTNGASPRAGLLQGKDGCFYGTTESGGDWNQGTVYRLSIPSAVVPRLKSPARIGNNTTLEWSAIVGRTYQVQFTTGLDQPDWQEMGAPMIATNHIATLIDSAVADPNRFYRAILLP